MLRSVINQYNRKIILISSLTLVMLILFTSLSVYSVMQRQIEAIATSGLEVALENTVKHIQKQIMHSVTNTRAISTRIFLTQSLEKFYFEHSQQEGIEGIAQSIEKILSTFFSGIEIYDIDDQLILSAGNLSKHRKLTVELNTGSSINTILFWNNDFIVRNSIQLVNEYGKPIGRVITEERMPNLTRIFTEATLIGNTSDFLLCAPVKGNNLEMDCFLRNFDDNQLKRMQRILNNQPLPVHFALEGQTGVKFTKDYRQIEVVAAHSPVAYGLGAVLKINKDELNNYSTDQIKTIISYLVLILFCGIAIISWLTLPLIQKLINQKESYLNERLKENLCLQKIRSYLALDQSTEDTCKNILKSLLPVFEFQEMAVAMIKLEDKQYFTPKYQDNLSNCISSAIICNGQQCGLLQVAYIRNFPSTLTYQQNLVDTIAHDLGRWYEGKEAEKRIIEMATHDALTGLPNRYLLRDRIEQILVHDTRLQRQMAVLFIDLDHFKTINDSLGHEIGDLLLKAVADRLKSCVRNEDTVARQGGDEFIVVLNSIAESLDAAKVAQKILDSFALPFHIHNNELHIDGSIGIAVFPDDGVNVDGKLRI